MTKVRPVIIVFQSKGEQMMLKAKRKEAYKFTYAP